MEIERRPITKCAILLAAISGLLPTTAYGNDDIVKLWVPAYLSAPAAPIRNVPPEVIPPPQEIAGTVRYKLTLWAGGEQLALRLSNEAGAAPLRVDNVTVRLQDAGKPRFLKVTFGGATSVVMPAGSPAVSDPVPLAVTPGQELLVSVHLPERFTHSQSDSARWSEYIPNLDQTMVPTLSDPRQLFVRPIVSAVLVSPKSQRPNVIVAFGDSITDGTGMTSPDARGWPDLLAARLLKERVSDVVVANAGISGNRLVADGWGISALARFDRDVLAFPSVSHVILLEGINDIGAVGRETAPTTPVTYEVIVGAYRQLIARAHQRGIRVFCATMLPFGGSFYFSEENERLRQRVNSWSRSNQECDGLFDFDRALREPTDALRLKSQFDSGDHLHPNDAGYQAMANFIDVDIFARGR